MTTKERPERRIRRGARQCTCPCAVKGSTVGEQLREGARLKREINQPFQGNSSRSRLGRDGVKVERREIFEPSFGVERW